MYISVCFIHVISMFDICLYVSLLQAQMFPRMRAQAQGISYKMPPRARNTALGDTCDRINYHNI